MMARYQQQRQGTDDHAQNGDQAADRRAAHQGPARRCPPPLAGAALPQVRRQRRPLRGPAIERRRCHAQRREQQQASQQRPGQLGGPCSARRRCPAVPSSASDDSAQFARSASHHFAFSLVFGVRRNAAFLANRPSTEARATTREVDCQMKNAPSASRQDAPVPRRSSATARTSPSSTSTGTAATRNTVSLRNSVAAPGGQVERPRPAGRPGTPGRGGRRTTGWRRTGRPSAGQW